MDNQAALAAMFQLQSTKTGQYLVMRILEQVTKLNSIRRNQSPVINLNWIPGHTEIYGKELADRTANEERTTTAHTTTIDFALRTSFSAMRRSMRKRYAAPLRVEASRMTDLMSHTSKTAAGKLTSAKTAKILSGLPRATSCLATQLRTGHLLITKSYRHRFKIIDSPRCSTCGVDDTISHRIFV
ncbi:hypothetical protein J056_000623 [Wallemia ichthyophaga EXF-994]|uniref:Uncharacterized protein n=1 Tax=Wallemia ichthyophaga (strain EXF-994 / CBS 113033) TaxID=1299270 RepID=R9AF47_WALI9|nr:uncharacterized protein J056_000623 [Wallemia ichthyophaga EXF-994]EOR00813.1 hypothetical protein J056_000623 [Wallemia ichthyophaga EXF-994]